MLVGWHTRLDCLDVENNLDTRIRQKQVDVNEAKDNHSKSHGAQVLGRKSSLLNSQERGGWAPDAGEREDSCRFRGTAGKRAALPGTTADHEGVSGLMLSRYRL